MKYTVKRIDHEATYAVMSLIPVDGQALEFEAGQYVTISAGGLIATPTRCFSIVSAPNNPLLQIAFRRDGDFTRGIALLEEGATVDVLGPFGDFVANDENRPVVMLAGGIGVTPFVSMLREMIATKDRRNVVALISGRSLTSIPFYRDIEGLINQLSNARIALFSGTASDSRAVKGKINRESLKQVAQLVGQDAEYLICGPDSFSTAMTSLLTQIGIDRDYIKTEAFAQAQPSQATRRLIGNVMKFSTAGLIVSAAFVIALDFIGVYRKNQAAASSSTAVQKTSTATTTTPETTSTTSPQTNDTSSTASSDTQTTQSTPTTYTAPTTTIYSPPVSAGS